MTNKPFNLKHALEHEPLLPPWWYDISAEDSYQQCSVVDELKKEVSETHSLYGKKVRLLARGLADDCLFELVDSKEVAQVHLTWKQSAEIYNYPITIIYDDLHQWYINEYIPNFFSIIGVPDNLTPLEELLIGLALGFVSVRTVEEYIYNLDLNSNNINEDEYLELISIDFTISNNEILRSLNSWYIKKRPSVRLDLNEIAKFII